MDSDALEAPVAQLEAASGLPSPSELLETIVNALNDEVKFCNSISPNKKEVLDEFKHLAGQWHVIQGFDMQLLQPLKAVGWRGLRPDDFEVGTAPPPTAAPAGANPVQNPVQNSTAPAVSTPTGDKPPPPLATWLRHTPPQHLISLRKRVNKARLVVTAARMVAEQGDASPSPRDSKLSVSAVEPLEIKASYGSYAILYHDAAGKLLASSDIADLTAADQLDIIRGAIAELLWLQAAVSKPAPQQQEGVAPGASSIAAAVMTGALPLVPSATGGLSALVAPSAPTPPVVEEFIPTATKVFEEDCVELMKDMRAKCSALRKVVVAGDFDSSPSRSHSTRNSGRDGTPILDRTLPGVDEGTVSDVALSAVASPAATTSSPIILDSRKHTMTHSGQKPPALAMPGTSASSLRMPWDAVPPVPDKKVKKEGLMETMVGTGTLTGAGTGIKRGTMSAAFDVGSATPSMSSAVMSVKQGPVTAAPISPLPPMYIHVSEGAECLWQWRAKRTRAQLLAAIGARRILQCLRHGIDWKTACLREKQKGNLRRIGRRALDIAAGGAGSLSGEVEEAWLGGCIKAQEILRAISSGSGAGKTPTQASVAGKAVGKPGKTNLSVNTTEVTGEAESHSKALARAAVSRLTSEIGDRLKDLDSRILQAENLERHAWLSEARDLYATRCEGVDASVQDVIAKGGNPNAVAPLNLLASEVQKRKKRNSSQPISSPSMSGVAKQSVMAALGELLALHRSLELVLCDGVEEALANCISEIAGLGGGVHTLAREEAKSSGLVLTDLLRDWESLYGMLLASSGEPTSDAEASRKALNAKRLQLKFKSILARQELTASEALLANIEAAKTRLFEAQFVIAFLRDDVYMQELERMVREFRQPLSEQLSPLNASRRHADSKSDSLPPIEKGAASSSGPSKEEEIRQPHVIHTTSALTITVFQVQPVPPLQPSDGGLQSPRLKKTTFPSPHPLGSASSRSIGASSQTVVSSSKGSPPMYSRGALTAVPEAESGQSSPVGASNHLGALSRDNISSARLHKKQSFKSRMEKRPVVEPKLAKLHEVLEHLREVYRSMKASLKDGTSSQQLVLRAKARQCRSKGSVAFWTTVAPKLCVNVDAIGSFSVPFDTLKARADDPGWGFDDTVAVEDDEFQEDDEGIVYNVREATRDAVVAFASARGGQQLYKNAHAVRTQYARASAELYVTKQAQAGLTRSDLHAIAVAKRDGVDIELRLLTCGDWIKRRMREAWFSEGQSDAMKAVLWNAPETKIFAVKPLRRRQNDIIIAMTALVKRRSVARFQDMQVAVLKAASKFLSRLLRPGGVDPFFDLAGDKPGPAITFAADNNDRIHRSMTGPPSPSRRGTKSSFGFSKSSIRSDQSSPPKTFGSVRGLRTSPSPEGSSPDRKLSISRSPAATNRVLGRSPRAVDAVLEEFPAEPAGQDGVPLPGQVTQPADDIVRQPKKGVAFHATGTQALEGEPDTLVEPFGKTAVDTLLSPRTRFLQDSRSSEAPVKIVDMSTPIVVGSGQGAVLTAELSQSGEIEASRSRSHSGVDEGKDSLAPLSTNPSINMAVSFKRMPTSGASDSPISSTVASFRLKKPPSVARMRIPADASSQSPPTDGLRTMFEWPDDPDWAFMRDVDLQAQHWLVTSYADISPESAASREYSLQKLLSRMEAGVGAALMPSSVAGATMDALPDGFRIPMCKDPQQAKNRAKRRFLTALGYFVGLKRLHALLSRHIHERDTGTLLP